MKEGDGTKSTSANKKGGLSFSEGTKYHRGKTATEMKAAKKLKTKDLNKKKRAVEEVVVEDEPSISSHEHTNKFYARFTLKMPQNRDIPDLAGRMVVEGIQVMQKWDPNVCIIHPTDDKRRIVTTKDIESWTHFYDDFSSQEVPKRSYKSTVRAGKTRQVKFTVMIGCDMDPKKLMDKIELDMYSEREGGGRY